MEDLILYLGAYLIGSIPIGFLLTKWKVGQKQINLLKPGLDIIKGAAAVTLAHAVSPTDQPDWVLSGFLALLGDEFSVYLKFKGVRGLGVSVGVFGALLYWMLVK